MKFGNIIKQIEKFIDREMTHEEIRLIELVCFCNHNLSLPSDDYLHNIISKVKEQQKQARLKKLKDEVKKLENE